MLYLLIVFIALSAIKGWDLLISPPAMILGLDESHPFAHPYHHHYTTTSAMCGIFPNLDRKVQGDLTHGSVSHVYHIAGCKTHARPTGPWMAHNACPVTINTAGPVTHQTSYALSIQCHYQSKPDCHPITVSSRCQSSNSMTGSIYVLCHKYPSKFQFHLKVQKFHCHNSSALALLLAINRSIYYLLNGTLHMAYDVNHIIHQLLLMLRQHITRHNDFKHLWIELLLSGMLNSWHVSLWILIIWNLRLHIVASNLWSFPKNKHKMNLTIDKMAALTSCLHFICFCICSKLTSLCPLFTLLVSKWNVKLSTGFIGGGRSARTDYEILKPYVVSTEVELKNPAQFSYVYGGHCTLDKALQEIKASREAQLVCNMPLALLANILTAIQTREVAKEHNLHVSRKSLAERRTAIETHVCTMSCNRCVTMFKPVKKNQKSIRHQSNTILKEIKSHPKVGKKSQAKTSRVGRNYKYYIQENIKFPPSPPSKRLMHKMISGFCNDTDPSKFEEAGCAVCGQLLILTNLIKLTDLKCSLDP